MRIRKATTGAQTSLGGAVAFGFNVFLDTIAQIGRFYGEVGNLVYIFLVSLAGYSVGLSLWVLNGPTKMVRGYLLQNALELSLRGSLTLHIVTMVIWFNVAWLAFAYALSQINRQSIADMLRKDSLTFLPAILLLIALIIFPDWSKSVFFLFLFILVAGVMVASKIWLLNLNIQASFESRLGPLSDKMVYVPVLIFAGAFSTLAILRYENLGSPFFDLGVWDNVVWNTSRGNLFHRSGFMFGNQLGEHMNVILALISPLYLFWSDPKVLLLLQGALPSLGALPVYWLARDRLGSKPMALAFSVAYLLFPAFGYINRSGFYPIELATSLLLFAFFYLQKRAYKRYILFVSLAMLTAEEVGLTGIAMGIYIFYYQRDRKIGLATSLASLGYFIASIWFVMPYFRGGAPYGFIAERFSALGPGTNEIIQTIVFNPSYVLRDTLVASKIIFLLHLFVPVLFLPLLSRGRLILMVPALMSTILTTFEWQHSIEFWYTAIVIPWFFVCSILGVETLLNKTGETTRRRIVGSLAVMLIATGLLANYYISPAPLARGFGLSSFEVTPRAKALNKVKALIPREASLVTTYGLGAHFSQRKDIYILILTVLPPRVSFIGDNVADYIFLDLKEVKHINSRVGPVELALSALASREYGAMLFEDDFLLLKKGHSRSQNEEISKFISTRRTFEVEEMPWRVGTMSVSDKGARNGGARYGSVKDDKAGFLSFGPYISLPPGAYRVSFNLKVSDNRSDKPVAALDVFTADGGEKVLAEKLLTGKDFRSPNEYEQFTLDFGLDKPTGGLEFRLQFLGVADLWADWIGLEPAPFKIEYTSSRLMGQTGQLEGSLRWAQKGKDKPGALVNGPYAPLPVGDYLARFVLKVGDDTSSEPAARIDVSAEAASPPYWAAAREIKGLDFRSVGAFQEFELPFTIDQADLPLEYRVWFTGVADLWFEKVTIRQVSPVPSPSPTPVPTPSPSPTPVPTLPPNTWEYHGAQLMGQTGQPDGNLRWAQKGKDKPGALVNGPYASLPVGDYLARFVLKVGDNTSPEAAARIDVSAEAANPPYSGGGREIRGRDFTRVGSSQEFEIPFTVERADLPLEYRVWFTGVADLWFEKVTIRQLSTPVHK